MSLMYRLSFFFLIMLCVLFCFDTGSHSVESRQLPSLLSSSSQFRGYRFLSPCLTWLIISSLWIPLGIIATQTSTFHKFHSGLLPSSVSLMTLNTLGKPYVFARTQEYNCAQLEYIILVQNVQINKSYILCVFYPNMIFGFDQNMMCNRFLRFSHLEVLSSKKFWLIT